MRAWVMEESATMEGIEEDKDGKDKIGLGFTQCGEACRQQAYVYRWMNSAAHVRRLKIRVSRSQIMLE